MVVIGGITRLTHSGLSIVEWKPIMGVIPPLTESAWMEVFEKYQRFPEYQLLNRGMQLSEFKWIFFWEYLHRLLGRMIGVVFFFPWVFFIRRRWIDRRMSVKLWGGFLLGGLQGALGWFMVKSGLVHDPHVSHYRLAAHLLLALGVLAYFFWMVLDLRQVNDRNTESATRLLGVVRLLTAGIVLQILYGAFTAGLRAGFGFNTFPKMNDEWFPTGFFQITPVFLNFFENPIAVQFIHRTMGWLLLIGILGLWQRSRRMALTPRQKLGVRLLTGMVLIQFFLGVTTLVWVVPVGLASMHQLGACILLLIALFLNHSLRSTKVS